jgi:hypothetical protein
MALMFQLKSEVRLNEPIVTSDMEECWCSSKPVMVINKMLITVDYVKIQKRCSNCRTFEIAGTLIALGGVADGAH